MRYKKINYNSEKLESFSIAELKKTADYWLRQFLLHNSKKKNGRIYCPIKKQYYLEKNIHVSHFIDRAVMCTRYDLDNVHLISKSSNIWDAATPKEGYKSLHHYDYEKWIISKIGEKKFNILLERSKDICIFAREDYYNIINDFKTRIKNE